MPKKEMANYSVQAEVIRANRILTFLQNQFSGNATSRSSGHNRVEQEELDPRLFAG
jgi:hypothetical protein